MFTGSDIFLSRLGNLFYRKCKEIENKNIFYEYIFIGNALDEAIILVNRKDIINES